MTLKIRSIAAALLAACATPAPDRESPELPTVGFDASVWNVDPRSGAFLDGERHVVRRHEDGELVDLTPQLDLRDLLRVRAFDGTVWIGGNGGTLTAPGLLLRASSTAVETIEDCVPTQPSPDGFTFDASAADDVWVATYFSDVEETELCHFDGAAAMIETVPFIIGDIVAAPSGLYAILLEGDPAADHLLFRATGGTEWTPVLVPGTPRQVLPLERGAAIVTADADGILSLYTAEALSAQHVAELPDGFVEVAVGAMREHVWAVEEIKGYEDESCFDPGTFTIERCTRAAWQQDVAYRLEGSEFREVGHADCDGSVCIATPMVLSDGRLFIVHDEHGRASVAE